jgi:Flp pilus assembly protein TadD
LLLSACVTSGDQRLGTGPPSLNVAHAALAAGSPAVALTVSNGILTRTPNDVPALLVQADALMTLGRLDEAETSYVKALAADPQSVLANIGLGRLRLRSSPPQAQALFLIALQYDAHNTTALNDLGIAYDLQGDHARAQAVYREVLGVAPTMRATEVNLALSMALSGQASEAVQMLKPLAEDPAASQRVRHDLAAALTLQGDRQTAAGILKGDMTPEDVDRALLSYEALRP